MSKELSIEITHKFEHTTISDGELDEIFDYVAWKKKPYFPYRGRVAWYIFKNDVELRLNGYSAPLKAAKIKGIGGYNPPNDAKNRDPIFNTTTLEPFQPTSLPLDSFASYPHIGFDTDGEFTFVYGKLAPIGGILHSRAIAEYECALHLLNNKVPAITPLAVARYKEDFSFLNEPMGAVICLSPSKYPYRMSEIQYGAALRRGADVHRDEFYCEVLRALEISGDPGSESTRLMALKLIGSKVGKLMHDFSFSGLYRYSAELPNFEFDFIRNEVVLTDLDSSAFLNTLSGPLVRLQVLRDLGSMVYHFIAKFANPLALGHYSIQNLLQYNPVIDLIRGYFPAASIERVEQISIRLWRFFIPHFMLINRHREKIQNEWSTERRRSYKMDHDLFFVLAIISLYPLFEECDLGARYADNSITEKSLMSKAERYLADRTAYLEYLLRL